MQSTSDILTTAVIHGCGVALPASQGAKSPEVNEAISSFERDICQALVNSQVKAEICDRRRVSLTDREPLLTQVTVFREGRSESQLAFIDGELGRRTSRPVIEAAISYEADNGAIEVVAVDKQTRLALVRVFARHFLGIPNIGERLRLREFSLEHLKRRYSFPTEAGDNIESVRVDKLRLMPLDAQAERITLESRGSASRDIWDMASSNFGANNPLIGPYRITQAHLVVRFKPTPGRREKRSLPITISLPHGCDLKERTRRELVIGQKYLRLWNILRDL